MSYSSRRYRLLYKRSHVMIHDTSLVFLFSRHSIASNIHVVLKLLEKLHEGTLHEIRRVVQHRPPLQSGPQVVQKLQVKLVVKATQRRDSLRVGCFDRLYIVRLCVENAFQLFSQ